MRQRQVGRYETLDALRGIAALAVVIFHLAQVKMEHSLVPYGYLAVDFFFVLSGFVISHAYEHALRERLSWMSFVLQRVIRLYPLAIFGTTLGVLVLLLKWQLYPDRTGTLPRILISGLFNCFMLPTLLDDATPQHDLFPGNGPLWSIFFEIAVNMLWAAFGVRMRTWALAVFAAASWAVFAGFAIRFQTADLGFDLQTFWGGMARVCFGFPLGVVVYRLHHKMRIPASPLGLWLLAAALIFVFSFPCQIGTRAVPWWDLVSVSIVLPGIVVLGVGQGASKSGASLGSLSYPIYVLHFPILLVASGLHQSVLSRVNVHLLSVASVAVIVVLSAFVLRFYDAPARRFLAIYARNYGLLHGPAAPIV